MKGSFGYPSSSDPGGNPTTNHEGIHPYGDPEKSTGMGRFVQFIFRLVFRKL